MDKRKAIREKLHELEGCVCKTMLIDWEKIGCVTGKLGKNQDRPVREIKASIRVWISTGEEMYFQ